MKIQMKFLKIMLRLWTVTLAVILMSPQLITASVMETETTTASPALVPHTTTTSIANDGKVLRLTTTTATIQLRLRGSDGDAVNDYFGDKEQLKTTTSQLQSNEEVTLTTITSPSASSSSSTLGSTASLTIQAKEILTRTQAAIDDEQQSNRKASEIAITPTLLKQHKNSDELETEIAETDSKQVTESAVTQQHPQQQPEPTTTEVSWQKEDVVSTQTTESNTSTGKDMNIFSTIPKQTHTEEAYEITTTTASSNTYQYNDNKADATTSPAEQTNADHVGKKEIKSDDETVSATLTLATDTQALENFKPLIKDANEKLIRERTVFANNDEWKQNLMPNELDYEGNKPLLAKHSNYEHNINWSPYLHPATPVTDFTGKLLQEQDGVITEIEQKFRLNEFVQGNEPKTTNQPSASDQKSSTEFTQTTTFSKESPPASTYSVNHKIMDVNPNPIWNRSPVEFIEKRVKKSFDFPMHRVASDAQHLQQHFDFANTKFKSNNNDQPQLPVPQTSNDGQQTENLLPARPQPEFSTTKFYNSKELYNEMLQYKTKQQQQQPLSHLTNLHDKDMEQLNNRVPSLTLNSFAVLHSPKIAKLEEIHEAKESTQQQQQQKSLAIKKVTVKATKHANMLSNTEQSPMPTTTTTTSSTSIEPKNNIQAVPTKGLSPSTLTEMPLAALVKTKKFQKELKRAKLLIKSMMPVQNTTTATLALNKSNKSNNKELTTTTIRPLPAHIQPETEANKQIVDSLQPSAPQPTTQATPTRRTSTNIVQTSHATKAPSSTVTLPFTSTNPSKTSLHPIVRPRILSRLQEKINSLECELQNLPQDSHLWRGNETHELLLPIMICKPFWTPTSWFANNRWVLRNSPNCSAASDTPENCKNDKDCTAMMVSWEGEAEIQSGDILIVEINDTLLTPKEINLTTSAHNTQVYQVTRSGHEHCDVTEGILLDITPLIVDGRKLVTLYDKDLTEGVNLLIVVSELWGAQCVRLKVTTKTENCGENADCSGKGICFSNYDMEEYECQCCSGFAGPHCEEIDACTPSPCTNNGICVDLSQGHEGNSYQCLCPYGYTGKNCQYELDPCNPAECMNGGSCVGNSTHFRCECSPGYTGPLCQHSLNECESSPCIHGICVDQEDGFRCFCQPGFAGELCNFEYNECESNPCQNGGECIDHIGSYECHCTRGYTGDRCQIKVDFCANKPCPEGRRCIDHGNDYSCECLGGRNGPDCNEMQRTQCNVNPCTHGGTCWSSGDSFYCACRPGYTGTMCEDEFVVETVVSSSEFMVDDTSARNFNDKSFGSSVVLKSPIELHNAYTAAIVLALVIFFVALYLTICHCKVNQTYRKFSTRTYGFLPILGFRLRTKQATSKISRHWLSGKGLGIGNVMRTGAGGATASSSSTSALHAATAATSKRNSVGHLPTAKASAGTQQHTHVGQLNERPFQRHLAMNLENDMYYTVDFSENSQHSPLIQ